MASLFLRFLFLLGSTAAFPAFHPSVPRYPVDDHHYEAPSLNSSRGPCPALNTLANHGYLNRDGRNIEKSQIQAAALDGFGIESDTIALALDNAFTVCEYVTGKSCGTTLTNLTLLAEPHAFEHDHSFSRQDYKMKYLSSWDEHTDNLSFNNTIFDTSLDVLKGASHVNWQMANEIRLQRESLAVQDDYPNWFVENIPVQEFEFGFIFAVMGDFNLPYVNTDPKIRVDWWRYWFINESFPTSLGWHKPETPRNLAFVQSASSRILAAGIPSTPSILPSGAIETSYPVVGTLPATLTTVLEPLAHPTPYVGPGLLAKRDAAQSTPTTATSGSQAQITGEPQSYKFKNPYVERLEISDISIQKSHASARRITTTTTSRD